MAVNQFQFAEAYTEFTIRDSQFHAALRRGKQSLLDFRRGLETASRYAQRMLLVGGGAIAAFVKIAADVREQSNRFNAVFRDQAGAIRKWSEELAQNVARSGRSIRGTMASFQAFFVGLGFGRKEAIELSKKMQSLAIDFGSFNNLADSEATQRFISALSGSSEVLDMFGINIKQAALEQELLNMGIQKSVLQASEQEKTLARVNVIMRAMGQQGAIGDAARTSGSMANRLKFLKEQTIDLAVELGETFMPIAKEFVAWLIDVTKRAKAWVAENRNAVLAVAKWGGAAAAAIVALNGITKAVITLTKAYTALKGAALLAGVALGGGGAAGGAAAGLAAGGTLATVGAAGAVALGVGAVGLMAQSAFQAAEGTPRPDRLSPEFAGKTGPYIAALKHSARQANVKMIERIRSYAGVSPSRENLQALGGERDQIRKRLERNAEQMAKQRQQKEKFVGLLANASTQRQREHYKNELQVVDAQIEFLNQARGRLATADEKVSEAITRIENALPRHVPGGPITPRDLGYGPPADRRKHTVETMLMSQLQPYLQQLQNDNAHREAQRLRQRQIEVLEEIRDKPNNAEWGR